MSILLNPGPVNLSDRVRAALTGPDLCHREVEFMRLQSAVRDKLLNVYGLSGKKWAPVLLTGSGTCAVEAMLSSIPAKREKVLIIENGVYGERMSRIAKVHGIKFDVLHHEWGREINIEKLDQKLYDDDFDYIAVVHHETTTGRLNDLARIAKMAARRDVALLIDGVSSFGAETIRFEDWPVAACAGTANKCLHGVPGICFVILDRAHLDKKDAVPRTLYLDLTTQLKQQDNGGTPFTPSVQVLYALDAALDEHRKQGGWQSRWATYRQRMDAAHKGLTELGIKPLLNADDCSCVLHAYRLPEGISYQEFHDRLKEYGFIIYAGQGEFAKRIFRISMMGAISRNDVERFIETVRKIVEGNQ